MRNVVQWADVAFALPEAGGFALIILSTVVSFAIDAARLRSELAPAPPGSRGTLVPLGTALMIFAR